MSRRVRVRTDTGRVETDKGRVETDTRRVRKDARRVRLVVRGDDSGRDLKPRDGGSEAEMAQGQIVPNQTDARVRPASGGEDMRSEETEAEGNSSMDSSEEELARSYFAREEEGR